MGHDWDEGGLNFLNGMKFKQKKYAIFVILDYIFRHLEG